MDKKAQWALVGAAWFMALSVAVLGWLAWRHFNPGQQDPAARYGLQADGYALCPVTKTPVKVRPDTPKVDYQGVVYHFSEALDAEGRSARLLFLMDPESYLNDKRP